MSIKKQRILFSTLVVETSFNPPCRYFHLCHTSPEQTVGANFNFTPVRLLQYAILWIYSINQFSAKITFELLRKYVAYFFRFRRRGALYKTNVKCFVALHLCDTFRRYTLSLKRQ